jgi:glutaredoxin 1
MFVVFGRPGCPYCIKAQQLLRDRRADFQFYDLNSTDGQSVYLSGYRTLVPSTHNTVPVVFWNKHFIGGYTELQQKL